MKIVYTHENSLLVENMKNVLQQAGIETEIKNQFVRSALGEVAAQHTWLELWLVDDRDIESAQSIIAGITAKSSENDWLCPNCNERNAPSFEVCWNCQHEHP